MKRVFFCLMTVFTVAVSFADDANDPVSSISVTQGSDYAVTVTYSLMRDAIVTAEFFVNGRKVVEQDVALSVSGAVNRYVAKGNGNEIRWMPLSRLGTDVRPLTVKLTAWKLSDPPDYMVAKTGGTKADIRFYTSAEALPDGGLSNRVYTTEKIVFRKIPAAGVKWRMGVNKEQYTALGFAYTEYASSANRVRPHYVTLTKDYYMSVYPLTQCQGAAYFGNNNCTPSTLNTYSHPWNGYSFNDIRGSSNGSLWPALGQTEIYAHQVDENSLIYNIRSGLGLSTVDLPTRAQWEFACRAGNGSNFYNGSDEVTEAMENERSRYGWGNIVSETQPVGLLAANPWGLYDMHGNVYFWVLDWNWDGNKSGDEETDPRGPNVPGARIWCGSCYGVTVKSMHSSVVTNFNPANGDPRVGVRLVCDADMLELASSLNN